MVRGGHHAYCCWVSGVFGNTHRVQLYSNGFSLETFLVVLPKLSRRYCLLLRHATDTWLPFAHTHCCTPSEDISWQNTRFGRATCSFSRRDQTLHLHADSHHDFNRVSLILNVYRNALNTHHQTSIWNMHGVSRGLMDGAIPPAAHDFAARMPSKTGIRPPPTFLTVYGEHVKM